ncbi:MAG: DNA adenine methylase [Caldilineaceae bacterium]|nr:DNA adenine methylase [Caldilineaceae bacterium]
MYQQRLFENLGTHFPSTRYQGSKAKLVDWIWGQIGDLNFSTALDAFGGTGVVGYRLKQEGKAVTYNDILRFNHQFGLALIENSDVLIRPQDRQWVLERNPHIDYPAFVQQTFRNIYFIDSENRWIDQTVRNIAEVTNPYRRALLFLPWPNPALSNVHTIFSIARICICVWPRSNALLATKPRGTNLLPSGSRHLSMRQIKRCFGEIALARPCVEMPLICPLGSIWSTSIRPIFPSAGWRSITLISTIFWKGCATTTDGKSALIGDRNTGGWCANPIPGPTKHKFTRLLTAVLRTLPRAFWLSPTAATACPALTNCAR